VLYFWLSKLKGIHLLLYIKYLSHVPGLKKKNKVFRIVKFPIDIKYFHKVSDSCIQQTKSHFLPLLNRQVISHWWQKALDGRDKPLWRTAEPLPCYQGGTFAAPIALPVDLAEPSETGKVYGQFTKPFAGVKCRVYKKLPLQVVRMPATRWQCVCICWGWDWDGDCCGGGEGGGSWSQDLRGCGAGGAAALLTYDIQPECHRNLWLRIHLAFVDAAVTWLGIFHMQCPILGVGGPHHLLGVRGRRMQRAGKRQRERERDMVRVKQVAKINRSWGVRLDRVLGKFNQCIQVAWPELHTQLSWLCLRARRTFNKLPGPGGQIAKGGAGGFGDHNFGPDYVYAPWNAHQMCRSKCLQSECANRVFLSRIPAMKSEKRDTKCC